MKKLYIIGGVVAIVLGVTVADYHISQGYYSLAAVVAFVTLAFSGFSFLCAR